MNEWVAGLLAVVLASNAPVALSNFVFRTTGIAVAVPDPNDPVERELQKLLAADDAAQAEVDEWIRANQAAAAKGEALPAAELNERIEARFAPVRKGYLDFIQRHPEHARARLAYASFLTDLGEEHAAFIHLEKARQLDPANPAVWNNLANYYGHNGPVTNAFDYYAKAIALNPREPVYYHNFGTAVYLFRKDAMTHFRLTEQEVFDKALGLYRQALALDPTNFPQATDLAQTYYGIKPPRTEEALQAWTNALQLAHDDLEREGVHIHLARVKLHAGRFAEARLHLEAVTNSSYADLKRRVARSLEEREKKAAETAPAIPGAPAAAPSE